MASAGGAATARGFVAHALAFNQRNGLVVVDVGRSHGRRGLLRRDACTGLSDVARLLTLNQCHGLVIVAVVHGYRCRSGALVKGGDFCAPFSEGDDLLPQEIFEIRKSL